MMRVSTKPRLGAVYPAVGPWGSGGHRNRVSTLPDGHSVSDASFIAPKNEPKTKSRWCNTLPGTHRFFAAPRMLDHTLHGSAIPGR